MIIQGLCTSAKEDFFKGVHQPEDLYLFALYSEKANLNPGMTSYTTTDEVTGKGYSAGGMALSGYVVGSMDTTAYLTWTQPLVWYNCNIFTAGGLMYNRSRNNKAIAVFDFGEIYTAKNGVLSIAMPPPGVGALIKWGG